jgi:acyl transferase domain-containing protein/NADPH:quinone reductase-like Zn-dependent oxidoreductase/NADP-dependent 3-hydroxy acid dehydrogenase YdfG/acyl carrier protein
LSPVHYLHDEIAVVGWSCRFPGANNISELWSLLLEGRCAITQVPADRFSLARYGHPRRNERGKSYTWAAGVLDDVWGFDPSVFGISPREAQQMDPQQRILLQLTWEALEDAGIRPSTIGGTEVGVFVGASQNDYAHAFYGDQAIADCHFATGNALAVLANRISHIFDLHGPSISFDTACSSSLVALHHATEALRSGRIETAIVGGINVIASPAEFISFSQAAMLSPTGQCRAFAADADGYVRAEGGAVLVLRRGVPSTSAVHGVILASDVNSDGRTNGIALPSATAQEQLVNRVYSCARIDPQRLSFVEAHGTGTPVGDPVEATALGRSLGRARNAPLPIGSIKTNIGHVEAASGLAGLLKALLALNHGVLPRTLHIREPNPNIDLARLNLTLCQEPLLLSRSTQSCAGVNSFGFGGTNAHVVIAPGRKPPETLSRRPVTGDDFFALSAASRPALLALAQSYYKHLAHLSDQDTAATASAVAHRRDWLHDRLVISATRQRDVTAALEAFISGSEHPQLDWGTAVGKELPVAFVYSGNGSQWAGMGISAYRHNATFRAHFDRVDDHFRPIAGWSLQEALFSQNLGDRLSLTRVAQPLIFAIQSALTAALRARGVRPSAVFGHSVGEVAAAEAAGILDLRTAVDVIYFRSAHQERVRGRGRMAAVRAASETIEELIERIPALEIAARNSPRAITLAGSTNALTALKRIADDRGIAVLDLGLDYPFHTALMAPIQAPLIADLKHITPHTEMVPFVSAVTGSCLPGTRLRADYWWLNIRQCVQFLGGIREIAKLGARFFIEIGPRGTLLKHIADSLAGEVDDFVASSVLDRNDPDQDPIAKVVSKALISGAQLDTATIFGADAGTAIALPSYPWQQQPFRFVASPEAVDLVESERHPFSGARYSRDALEWYAHIDTALFPALADHKVGERVLFPGTGFLEIALAVGRAWLRTTNARLADFEILKPLDLTNGETREIMSRVSPNSNTVEIFSRPRLSQASWLLHCRAKFLHGEGRVLPPRVPEHRLGRRFDPDTIYHVGDASGLHYGPAFRLLDSAVVVDDTFIRVELGSQAAKTDFVLDPIRLDACCHGMLIVFAQLQAPERDVSYLPVRFDEVTLVTAGSIPHSAIIEVLSKDQCAILANYYFFGPNQELLAILRGVRWQAVQLRRASVLEANAFVELPQLIDGRISGMSGPAAGADAIVTFARRHGLLPQTPSRSKAELMVEGCATAAAYAIASALADAGAIDIDALIGSGRLPLALRAWLRHQLVSLAAAGLVKEHDGQWHVISDPLMPGAAAVVQDLAVQHPERAAELLIAGAIAGLAKQVAASRAITASPQSILSANTLDFYDAASASLREASEVVERLLENEALWPNDRALRVIQIGFGPLTESLLSLRRRRNIHLTVFEPDRRRFDRAQRLLAPHGQVVLAGAEEVAKLGPFDLALATESLHRLPDSVGLAGTRQLLAPLGVLLALEPPPSLFRDLAFGLDPSWLNERDSDRPAGRLKPTDSWLPALERAGFVNVQTHVLACDSGLASLIVAEAEPSASAAAAPRPPESVVILDSRSHAASNLGTMVEAILRDRGVPSTVAGTPEFGDPVPAILVHILDTDARPGEAVDRLTACCLEMKACAERFGRSRATHWFVFTGALASDGAKINPIATGAWAFSRTLANEFPNLDVRRIDIAPNVPDGASAARLRDIILSGTPETELQIDGKLVRAVRADTVKQTLDRAPARSADALGLQRRLTGAQRFDWQPIERTPPGPTEVEIAVAATGLNFRDLMSTLSLLPDDIIAQSAGPALGCECAGEVTRVGASVRRLQPGDRVAAFATAAFASYVTVAADQVAKLPAAMSYQAGATIPVAFLTAYYSLVTLAQLKRGEWVLIHGGAGGVGMAAIQIALARKARVIATAGSNAKRNLLKVLGVQHALDSRSTTFVDDVRTITGDGVDVVLNSLAGEAMERSIGCLRAFGRFVELGKRDYVANTHIGLRSFRNNVSYFGVDLGQLMMDKTNIVRKIYADLMRQFKNGVLTPLPYGEFRSCDLPEAFHLMQHSSHIGKIVVKPPAVGSVRRRKAPFAVSAIGTHVITGGLGGFGLAAAKWLVARGARHLVLIGRRGAATDEAKAVVADLSAQGVAVYAEPCDITDRRAVEKLFEYLAAAMPPVVGIHHAAMVLDDGRLANLDEARFRRVLAPKVKGLENLDAVTCGMTLDYFVLFSSVTTLLGNPGQANYVAANAYMEGVARRRRQDGRPALAVGWGPITDVGLLARSKFLRSRFQKVTGVHGMRAAEALDLMAQALALPSSPDFAVIHISPTEGVFSADRLPVLKSPTYANLVQGNQADSESQHLDLPAIAKSQGIEAVRRVLTNGIVSQLARVLHARAEEINRVRPLGELGLDSLMALEFAMNLEESFGTQVTLTSSMATLTIAGLVNEIICQLDLEPMAENAVVKNLAERHFEKVEPRQLAALEQLVVDVPTKRKGALS